MQANFDRRQVWEMVEWSADGSQHSAPSDKLIEGST
jgi:hypothetical protein